jgi:SAM-dependent methyltransferase
VSADVDDVFRARREANAFDRLVVDVPRLFERYPIVDRRSWPGAAAGPRGLYAHPLLPVGSRVAAWKLLHRLSLDRRWFETFQSYWSDVLGGRPLLTPEDFHFLRGVYRMRHQDNQVPDTTDPAVHLAAWQQPELLYQLFFQVFTESFAPKLEAASWLDRFNIRSFCEYGCATAPVTTTYRTFFGPHAHAVLIDLPTVALHYAAHKFRGSPTTEVSALEAASGLLPPDDLKVEAIVCLQVFEHLLEPLAVIHRLVERLTPPGLLIFDYMESEGHGLDSIAGARERDAVLRFIGDRFDRVPGSGNPDGRRMAVVKLRR